LERLVRLKAKHGKAPAKPGPPGEFVSPDYFQQFVSRLLTLTIP
jgi:hypothetical protein